MSAAGERAEQHPGSGAGRSPSRIDAMLPRPPARRPVSVRTLGFWVGVLATCVASGMLYGLMAANGRPLVGAVYGLCSGTGVLLFEQGVLAPGVRTRLRRLPWLISVIATEAVFIVLVMAGIAVAGLVLWTAGLLHETLPHALLASPTGLLYALIVLGIVVTMLRMRDLIGAQVFRNILLGRYHRPVEEERIFLFIDLIGSTAYAQSHGDLRAQAFLSAIFAALAEPVRRSGGAIDDYVGDMALVTWPMKAGVQDARCVACVIEFLARIAASADVWHAGFGQVPAFRAALHGGKVVTAEVGVDRHKVSYFGDVVNTTGRIETLCRNLDVPLLISSDLMERLPGLPEGVRARPLGAHGLKGRGHMLTVYGLELHARAAVVEAAAA